jgi:4-amino-4-deoxy-L-arabinose transferase-like glycosyltransferase
MINKKYYPVVIALSAILLFLPFLGSVHLFDWDEINFAESAREMIVTGNFSRVQIDFQPFWEKPPLFFWMQATCMKIIGINEYAARLPNAIFGITSVMTFYFIGKRFYDEKFGLIWALAYMGSFLPHLYFKSGIIDPVFNYFIFMTIYCLYLSINIEGKKKSMLLALFAGISIGLATLTKGPVGFLVVSLCVLIYWARARFKKITSLQNVLIFVLSFILVTSLWFGPEMLKNGPWFLKEFINYQADLFLKPVAGHGGPLYYHFLIVFLGCFPISVLALPLFFKKNPEFFTKNTHFLNWMYILFWVVMILFTIVKTKIVHYSSLAYFPLSFIAACYIYDLVNDKTRLRKYLPRMIVVSASIFSFLLAALPYLAEHSKIIMPYIKDQFTLACLNTAVNWSGYEPLIGIIYFIVVLISVIMLKRNNFFKGFITLFYATSFCMFFYLFSVVPKIEKYSQGPYINFLQSIKGQDAYVNTYGFYSYAPFYYFQKMTGGNPENRNKEWLFTGVIDKPVYLITKVNYKDTFDRHPDCRLIKKEGGFLFYLRLPLK